MMRCLTITFALVALVAQTAQAGHLGLGWGELGLGGHRDGFEHDGFGFGGGFGDFGGFGFNTDRIQSRFETRFENLQSDYDTGLADVEDFYNSDEYNNVVDGMERLVDRYDLFLSGVERSVTRLGDFISIANDDLTYYDDLIAKYEARTDLSQERIDRIVSWLTNKQDRLSTRIDLLTEKQTTLSDNLSTYQSFSTDLSTYLADIITAGGGTAGDTSGDTAAALLSTTARLSAMASATLADDTSVCDATSSALSAAAVPEPALSGIGAALLGLLRLRRRRRSG